MRKIQRELAASVRVNRQRAVAEITAKYKGRDNITRFEDLFLEHRTEILLHEALQERLITRPFVITGEENRGYADFEVRGSEGIVALLDMVDGTDLFARDLGNWCSAILFYRAADLAVLAAVVGDAFGRIYFATAYERHASILRKGSKDAEPIVPAVTEELEEAYVCFYGQKAARLSEAVERAAFLAQAKRVYNLGGTPMLVEVADGSMDGVFELSGQAGHDFVAGAFICAKAGATVTTLDGHPVLGAVPEVLRRPAQRGPGYVAAATTALAEAMRNGIR